jgi:hypothetical protein
MALPPWIHGSASFHFYRFPRLVARSLKDYSNGVKMILLILGWHLTLIGVLAVVLGFHYALTSCTIFGIGSFMAGLALAIIYRKVLSSYRSDSEIGRSLDRPLD